MIQVTLFSLVSNICSSHLQTGQVDDICFPKWLFSYQYIILPMGVQVLIQELPGHCVSVFSYQTQLHYAHNQHSSNPPSSQKPQAQGETDVLSLAPVSAVEVVVVWKGQSGGVRI